jgi:excisionase family DNA binding protein
MSVQAAPERSTAEVDGDELLTVFAVARIFNVGRPTIYRLLTNGSLGAIRIGGSLRIPRGEIRAFLARNAEGPLVVPERETAA